MTLKEKLQGRLRLTVPLTVLDVILLQQGRWKKNTEQQKWLQNNGNAFIQKQEHTHEIQRYLQ